MIAPGAKVIAGGRWGVVLAVADGEVRVTHVDGLEQWFERVHPQADVVPLFPHGCAIKVY